MQNIQYVIVIQQICHHYVISMTSSWNHVSVVLVVVVVVWQCCLQQYVLFPSIFNFQKKCKSKNWQSSLMRHDAMITWDVNGNRTRDHRVGTQPPDHGTKTELSFLHSTRYRMIVPPVQMRETTTIHARNRSALFSKNSLPVLDLKNNYTYDKNVESGSETHVFWGVEWRLRACIAVRKCHLEAETVLFNNIWKYIFHI